MTERLSEHFTLAEMIESQVAARLGIDNTPGPVERMNLSRTATMLEKIREVLCKDAGIAIPIIITSGYRCPNLNQAIWAKGTSHHVLGAAADFKAPLYGDAYKIAHTLAMYVDELGIGQLIHEYRSWVHVSWMSVEPENRILTIDRGCGGVRVQQGISRV